KMRPHTNLLIFVVLTALVSVGFAQETGRSGESMTVPSADKADTPSFPYDAEITGDDVYIRSGPGTNFYEWAKLNKGDKVKVVGKQFSWSRIAPPPGSFSWISMQFVEIDKNNPDFGKVTGDRVRVYAGSETWKAMHSTSLQGKLDKDDRIKLLGEQMDGYYKIAPPPFAYLWVSTQFIKPVAPEVTAPLAAEARQPEVMTPLVAEVNQPDPAGKVETSVEPNEPNAVTVEAPPKSKLEQYRDLQKKVKAEREKPIEQQDYTNLKKSLLEIANDKEAGNAAKYAKFVLRQIEGIELALVVVKQVQLQSEQLNKVKEGIDKTRATKLAKVEDLGRFAAIGQFQTFALYGTGNYRIVDESGKMICYALPSEVVTTDLSSLIGKKVGIMGLIEPHLPTKQALVRFSEIVELK
ncbi:MAG: SH3 domain-containing protein, partial [Planctomycetota bacterium]